MAEDILDDMGEGTIPASPAWPPAFRYGLIGALLAAVYMLILFFIGQESNQSFSSLAFLIPLITVIMCIQAYKKERANQLTWGEGFAQGMRFFLMYALLSIVFSLLYMYVINPDYMQTPMDMAIERMEDRGMSDEQIDIAMKMTGFMMKPPMMILIGLLINLFLGAVISAIVALFTKNR